MRHVAILSLLATTVAAQSPAIPATPAGRVFQAWLTAFNSGDIAQVRAFDARHPRADGTTPEHPEDVYRSFHDRSGGFTVARIEKQEATSIVALLQERHSDNIARFELTVTGDEPAKVVTANVSPTRRPDDLAIPRMTEADALAALSARVDEFAAADRFSGIILIARNGKVLLQKTAGLANRETKTPVTPDTKFRIGSMNKMFTAVAILRLVEAGKIKLDDPIGTHLKDYPNKDIASRVTVRHLLTHRGGTGDIFGPEFSANRLTLKTHDDYLKLYGARGFTHEPGAEFRYSNYGYVLLGAIIERVSGVSYYDYVRQHVFAPAGMTNTDSLTETDAVTNRSVGYMKRGGAWTPNTDTLPVRGTAAGGGYSTAGDLLKFAQALEAGTLLSKTTFATATTVHSEMRPGSGYGMGFGVLGNGPSRFVGHNGGAPGMNGDLRVYPQLGYVVVGLSNLDPPAASRVVDFFANRMPVIAGSTSLR